MFFCFADGEDICVYSDGKITKYSSEHVERYKRTSENIRKSKEWKTSGENALMRGDALPVSDVKEQFAVSIGGIYPTADKDKVAYTFSVNQSSGIYKKYLNEENVPEDHVINSNNLTFFGGMLDITSNSLAVSVQNSFCTADIGVFDLNTNDYRLVTDGDSLDVDPYISPDEQGIIYFSSRGVGRDNRGEFAGFSPSVIWKLDLNGLTVENVASSPKYSYIKPVKRCGKLYAIRLPRKERKSSFFLDLILFPYRILKAIALTINMFVTATTGKSLTDGSSNPARGREYDSKKLTISGNLIDVEKTYKKNASKKDSDFGFIPRSWQLIEVESGKIIKSGIGDFDVAEDGTVIATNGRRIFAISEDGKTETLCKTEFCARVNCPHSASVSTASSIFDL